MVEVERSNGVWAVNENPPERTAPSVSAKPQFQVSIRQDENTPPRLVATGFGREAVLSSPNSALQGVEIGKTQKFTWRDFDGVERAGGLILPATHTPGSRVPVVIQLAGYTPDLFMPDGDAKTTYAAQALAARGIAVLSIQSRDLLDRTPLTAESVRSAEPEGDKLVRRLDAVVDALVDQGIAQPMQIGLSGFSRTGFHARYAVLHPNRMQFAAAIVSDAADFEYSSYLRTMAGQGNPHRADQYLAFGRSFWNDPMYWLKISPSFNADRLNTPTLFTRNDKSTEESRYYVGNEYTSYARDEFGQYFINKRPFDSVIFPDGIHQLDQPAERVASLGLTVDWFAFWLMGEEDPDVRKAQQYERWRKIKTDWLAADAATITTGDQGFIVSRSGTAFRIADRKIGLSPQPGDTISIQVSPVDGTYIKTEKSIRSSIKLRPVPTQEQLLLARSGGAQNHIMDGLGFDEVLANLHEGETAQVRMPRALVDRRLGNTLDGAEQPEFFIKVEKIERKH